MKEELSSLEMKTLSCLRHSRLMHLIANFSFQRCFSLFRPGSTPPLRFALDQFLTAKWLADKQTFFTRFRSSDETKKKKKKMMRKKMKMCFCRFVLENAESNADQSCMLLSLSFAKCLRVAGLLFVRCTRNINQNANWSTTNDGHVEPLKKNQIEFKCWRRKLILVGGSFGRCLTNHSQRPQTRRTRDTTSKVKVQPEKVSL